MLKLLSSGKSRVVNVSDIDECTGDSNVCTEECENVPGSYNCGCHGNGYRIGDDGTSCVGKY